MTAIAVIPFLSDLDSQSVLLRILRNAHLGLQRADDVLELAVVWRKHERVGSLAIVCSNDVLR